MRRPSVFVTDKTVNEADQIFTIKCAEQNAAGRLCRDQVRKRHDIEIGYAPDLLLEFFDCAQLRSTVNVADDDGCVFGCGRRHRSSLVIY